MESHSHSFTEKVKEKKGKKGKGRRKEGVSEPRECSLMKGGTEGLIAVVCI